MERSQCLGMIWLEIKPTSKRTLYCQTTELLSFPLRCFCYDLSSNSSLVSHSAKRKSCKVKTGLNIHTQTKTILEMANCFFTLRSSLF